MLSFFIRRPIISGEVLLEQLIVVVTDHRGYSVFTARDGWGELYTAAT